jgi:hypothetical protein
VAFQSAGIFVTQIINDNDPRIAQGHARLDRYWSSIGASDPDLIAYLVNPMFQGKPAWPNTRQAYRIVRPPGSLIIASDGLCDPFVGTDVTEKQGFGCEVYIEAPEFSAADFDTLRGSWAFRVIENFAMNVADWRGLSQQIARHGVISTEFDMRGVLPDTALLADGAAGFLVNLVPSGRPARIDDMPCPIDIVALTLLTPAELDQLRTGGAAARQSLAAARAGAGGHISRLPT